MRARLEAPECVRTSLPFKRRVWRWRILVLLPVAAAAVLALHAPAALARPSDSYRDSTVPRFFADRRIDRWDDVRPRRRAGRYYRGVRRYGYGQRRVTSRNRARTARARPARQRPSARTVRHANRRVIAPSRNNGFVPLEQRSLVATHPLLPDPLLDAENPVFAETAAPRCRSAHPSAFALAVASFGRDFKTWEPALVEGAWPHCRSARHPQSNWQLASLGPLRTAPAPSALPSLSGGSIRWVASAACLASPLRAVLAQVAANFGPLTVNSTCRSPSHNRRVGGAPRSYHLKGAAVDFRVRGNYGSVLGFLARLRSVGGLKHYGSGVFHIDTGPRRTWGARRARLARR